MRKRTLLVGLLLSASILVGGCGDNGKQKLEVFSTKMENQDILRKLTEDYMALHPDVEIDFQSPPDGGIVLRTKLTKNRVPDVILMGGDATYKDLASSGVLMDLSDLEVADSIKDAYKQQVFDRNKDQVEKLYGLPYATNAEGVIYNVDLFKQYGVEIPTTYDELIAACEVFLQNDVNPIYFTFKDAWTIGPLFMPLAGNLTSEDFVIIRQGNESSFSDTHVEVAEKIIELTKYGQKDQMGKSYDDGNIAFANGEAAMYFQGNWAIPNIRKANPNINIDMFTLPAHNDPTSNKVISGVDVMATIGVDTKKEELAKDFVQFIFEEENMKAYMKDQFAFSGMDGFIQEDPSVQGLTTTFEEGRIAGFLDHFYPTGFDYAVDAQAFIGGNKDIEAFLKKLDVNYDKYNAMQ